MSPSWFEAGSKVKVEPLYFWRFFDVRMGGEVSSEEEDRTLFFSNILCIVSAMKGCEMLTILAGSLPATSLSGAGARVPALLEEKSKKQKENPTSTKENLKSNFFRQLMAIE